MKKCILFQCALLISIFTYAQPSKKSVILSLDGHYFKKTTENGSSDNFISSIEKHKNLMLSAEYFISNRFSFGVGIGYRWSEGTLQHDQYIGNEILVNYNTSGSEGWIPQLFAKYYIPIIHGFYIVPQAIARYTKNRLDLTELYIIAHNYEEPYGLNDISSSNDLVQGFVSELMVKDFTATLQPNLVYFFTKRLGISFNPGGLQYYQLNGDLKDSDWIFSFKPQYWTYGIKVII